MNPNQTNKMQATILIVDDIPENLNILREILESEGYNILGATSGESALQITNRATPDLILLDIVMDDLNGFEVCRRLKAEPSTANIPVIFISVKDESEEIVRGFQVGGVDYITKPFQKEEVLVRVETHLKINQLTETLLQNNKELEKQTVELTSANQKLEKEIIKRKRAEAGIQASLAEKEVLLREIHHRVKNNMQVIYGLLTLQEGNVDDDKYSNLLQESKNRIVAMALVHDKLYQSENLASINFAEYISSLASTLFQTYRTTGNIALKMDVEDVSIGIDSAIPCGLILNELISNSLKHAFPDNRDGEIRIYVHAEGLQNDGATSDNNGNITLIVSNNGVEFPEDLDWKNTESLGLQLVNILTQQLDGTIELDRSSGTAFKIRWHEERS